MKKEKMETKFRNKIVEPVKSKKILFTIFALLILMLILIIFNFFSLLKTRRELKVYITAGQIADNFRSDGETEGADGVWSGLGDNFSSFAYLDRDKTDMVLDDMVTSLVFPPVFTLEKRLDISETGIDSKIPSSWPPADNWVPIGEKDACLFSPRNSCLKVVNGNRLQYNNRNIDFPAELATEKIKQIDVSFLTTRFVVSFVVEQGGQEGAYSYFFDGTRYSPIIGKSSAAKIITKYGRLGGVMAAGGEDNDFILMYSGYEARAFHYRDGELADISRFFGLRVSDGGFYPHIIKQGSGKDSLWYVLSLNDKKIKLIKLWQNGTESIQGGYDFSPKFKDFSSLQTVAFREVLGRRGEIEFLFIQDVTAKALSLKDPGVWLFKDGGFDNTQPRRAHSLNLNHRGGNVSLAIVENMFYSAGFGISHQAPTLAAVEEALLDNQITSPVNSNHTELYFVGSDGRRLPFKVGETIAFAPGNKDIHWEAVFKPENSSEYSPFFDHVSNLYYYVSR